MATKAPTIVAKGDADLVKQFRYKARNAEGKIVEGQAKAVEAADVTNELLKQGLIPLSMTSGAGASLLADDSGLRRRAKKKDLVVTSRMLASMLDSGLSYMEALDVVRKDVTDPLLANALNEVRVAVQNGSSLSKAIVEQGDVFPPMMGNLITSGEAAGKVKEAMNRVADQLDKEDKMRAKIKKATMQPLILFCIASIIFSFMLIVLIPKFTNTYIQLGGPGTKLPWLTQQVVYASNIAKILVPTILVIAVPSFLYYRRIQNKPGVRAVMDPFKLKVPVFGKLFHVLALSRFAGTLGSLLDAGVDRLQALDITAHTVGNISMEKATLAARDAQRNGKSLIDPLKAEPLFPNMLIQMTEAGERSGRTAFMLGKAADLYDRKADEIMDALADLIQPIFMIFIGVFVGVVVVSIYLPYMGLADVIDKGQ